MHFIPFVTFLKGDRNVPFSVVDSIPKSRRVHDSELEFDAFLLNIHRVFGDFYCLSDSLWVKETNGHCFFGLSLALASLKMDLPAEVLCGPQYPSLVLWIQR